MNVENLLKRNWLKLQKNIKNQSNDQDSAIIKNGEFYNYYYY